MRVAFFSAACGLVAVLSAPISMPAQEAGAGATRPEPPLTRRFGFKTQAFAEGALVKNPTSFAFDNAGRLLVTESHRWREGVEDNVDHPYWVMDDLAAQTTADRAKVYEKYRDHFPEGYFTRQAERVIALRDTDGDGRADAVTEVAGGFNDALDGTAAGVIAGPSGEGAEVFLASIPHVWRLSDGDGDGVAETRTPLASGFGVRTSVSGHDLHGLVWGPDGKLYFSLGDRGYHVVTKEGRTLADPGAGAVFRCDPDGSELEVFYYGLRNPQELAFNERGDLFTVDNNASIGDACRVNYLVEGGDTGWHMGHQALTTFKPCLDEGGFEQTPHWISERWWDLPHAGQPRWLLPPVGLLTQGPSGLLFTSGLALPEELANSFLVCDYLGSANHCKLWSFKLEPAGAGYALTVAREFHTGIAAVDVTEGPDGKLYVLDFGGGWTKQDRGAVQALWWPEGVKKPVIAETKALLSDTLTTRPVEELLRLLSHPDLRVRQRAQFALVTHGEEVVPVLAEVAQTTGNLHTVWALRQLKAAAALRALLDHATPELRAQAARALGDLRDADAAPALRRLLRADEPRERLFAALALGKIGDREAVGDVLEMIERRGVDDPFLRHGSVMALAGAAAPETLAALATHPSTPARLSAVLALRRQGSARVADYLRDLDPVIAAEAMRAINDSPIPAAQPALAAQSRRFLGQAPPPHFQEEPLYRRLLRALQVTGTPEAAAALAGLAQHPVLSESFRLLALRTLENFLQPPPIDPTTGWWRPLPDRMAVKEPIRQALAPELAGLLTHSQGRLTAGALRVAGQFGLPVAEPSLLAWAAEEKEPLELRLAALRKLGPAVRPLLDTSTPAVRAAAARRWVEVQPADAETALRTLASHGTTDDLRALYDLLATAKTATAPALLVAELQRLLMGEVPPPVRLDLVEAATRRAEPEVGEKLAAVEAALVARQRSFLEYTLEGGDPARGREVFVNQGTCAKCHRVAILGGSAGPELDGVAVRLTPEALLQSLVDPSAVITDGYGIIVLTLKDGTVMTGTPLEEHQDRLTLRTPTGGTETIPAKEIATREPPISPMPPLGLTLAKKDLRDLLAYLQSLR